MNVLSLWQPWASAVERGYKKVHEDSEVHTVGGTMRVHLNLSTVVKRSILLEKLRENRAEHADVVREAREGYIEKAKKALAAKLDEIKSGKLRALQFNLRLPEDYTSVYDTIIGMLEMSTQDTVTLTAGEFRNFVEDKWDWTRDFYTSNAGYSGKAAYFVSQEPMMD